MVEARLKEKLLAMTWDDLRKWSDPRSVERGRKYTGNVEPPIALADGSIAAKVHGSETYYTRLAMDAKSALQGTCTCPVGYACKHAVALALVASKALQEKGGIEEAGRLGKGWKSALEELNFLAAEADEWDEPDDGDELDDDTDSGFDEDDDGEAVNNTGVRPPSPVKDKVLDYVAALGEAALRNLLSELVAAVPSVRKHIEAKLAPGKEKTAAKAAAMKKTPKNLVAQVRRAIKDATRGYYNPYDRYGHDEAPDYSAVLSYFEDLRDTGDWKILMELGEELKERANEHSERSEYDEGEIARETSRCMDVVARTVMESDLDPVEKVKWEADIKADDSYCVLDDMEVSYRTALKTDSAGWKKIADYLVGKWEAAHVADSNGICLWAAWVDVAQALENAGEVDEAVRTLRDRLEDYDSLYIVLAELLARHGRLDEAKAVCRKGMAELADYCHGKTVDELRKKLRGWAAAEGDGKSVAAYDLAGFLLHPWIENYDDLKKSCAAAGVWEQVQAFLRRHFETGCPVAKEKKWPLPKVEVKFPDAESGAFPNYDMLIDLAVREKRGLDALKWFKAGSQKEEPERGFRRGFPGDREWDVADAVSDVKPDAALAIWRGLIDKNLESASEECYGAICKALAMMQPVMKKSGRLDDWRKLIDGIRTEYKRRRNLVKMLDDLVRERGISSRIADYQQGTIRD